MGPSSPFSRSLLHFLFILFFIISDKRLFFFFWRFLLLAWVFHKEFFLGVSGFNCMGHLLSSRNGGFWFLKKKQNTGHFQGFKILLIVFFFFFLNFILLHLNLGEGRCTKRTGEKLPAPTWVARESNHHSNSP
ncbi:hypothetical protein MCOR25_003085 [Pyricularia grisea]|nr:hypothetical protein MCOR25_003085 [Pyricularia grisea]